MEMSLLFEALKTIGEKIDSIPPLEAAMKRLESGIKLDSTEGEICSLFVDLKKISEKCK